MTEDDFASGKVEALLLSVGGHAWGGRIRDKGYSYDTLFNNLRISIKWSKAGELTAENSVLNRFVVWPSSNGKTSWDLQFSAPLLPLSLLELERMLLLLNTNHFACPAEKKLACFFRESSWK